ncbi:MAG: glycosyltransferase [Terriglobia bacterium]
MSPGSPPGGVDPSALLGTESSASGSSPGVCHIASGDLWAGAEAQVAALLQGLKGAGRFRLSALIRNPGRLAEELRNCGIDTTIIPENEKGLVATCREAARFLRGKNIQILHSHRYKENLLAGALALRGRIPCVVQTLHGMPEPHKGLRQWLIRSIDRTVSRFTVDRVISVSPEMTQRLRGTIAPHKLVTIINGIDPARVRSGLSATEAKTRLGISADCSVLGVAGRLEPIKRLDIFLSAAARIAATTPRATFVVAGDGRERARLENLAGALGIRNQVLFLGHRNDIYDVLRAFDILVLCSDHEGLPMVLLEALALGVVVVARAVGGIPEVVRHGETGILVKSDDPAALAAACLKVLADPPLRRRLSEAGARSVADRFSLERMVAQVSELYCTLVESE